MGTEAVGEPGGSPQACQKTPWPLIVASLRPGAEGPWRAAVMEHERLPAAPDAKIIKKKIYSYFFFTLFCVSKQGRRV